MVQAESLLPWQQAGQGLADRGVVQGREPQALDRAAVATMLHQLAGDHLAFAVGVGGDHQFPASPSRRLTALNWLAVLGLTSIFHFPE